MSGRTDLCQMISLLLQLAINTTRGTNLYLMISVLLQIFNHMSSWTDLCHKMCRCRFSLICPVEQTCVRWYLCCCRFSLLCPIEETCARWYLCCCRFSFICTVEQTCVRWYLCCCRFSFICAVEQTCVRWYMCCCRPSLKAQNIWKNNSTTGSYYHGWVLVFWRQRVRETITEAQKYMTNMT